MLPITMPVSEYPAVDAGLRILGMAGPVLLVVLVWAFMKINRSDQIRYLLRGMVAVLVVALYAANIHRTVTLTEQEVIISRMLVGRQTVGRDEITAVETRDVLVRGSRNRTLLIYLDDGRRITVRSSGREREIIRDTLVEHLQLQP